MLMLLLHASRGPFYSPKAARIRWRPNLPSVGWCTGQSGAPPDSHCSCPVRDLLPFLAQTTVAAPGPLAHRTVRCPLPTVGAATRRPWIARSTVALATVGSPDSPVHHRTVQ
jgi:hypothetical protein